MSFAVVDEYLKFKRCLDCTCLDYQRSNGGGGSATASASDAKSEHVVLK